MIPGRILCFVVGGNGLPLLIGTAPSKLFYVCRMDETMQELEYKYVTGNAVTDVIINDKCRRAEKAGIRFDAAFRYRLPPSVSSWPLLAVPPQNVSVSQQAEHCISARNKSMQPPPQI